MRSSVGLAVTSAIALVAGISSVWAADGQVVGLGAGDLLVRARVVGVLPDTSGHDTTLHGAIGADDSYIPEVDAAYFLTDYLAAEIIAGTTEHNIKDTGNILGTNLNLGHVWLLPPTVTAQFHPLAHSVVDPYFGAGVNYTVFYGAGGAQNILGATTKVTYKNSFGEALQFGVNYQVNGPWFANIDVKKLFLPTTAVVKLNGVEATRAKVNIDPWLVGIGIGYRF